MAKACFQHIHVAGIASAVPTHIDVPNEQSDAVRDGKAKDMTGVLQRRFVSEEQTASDLCFVAAQRLMEHLGYQPEDIDCIIHVTQSPDYHKPATAHILHKRLSMKQDCMALDVNLGCSGYVYGLYLAASLIESRAASRVLLSCGESEICLCPKAERGISSLFGDAGTATIIEYGSGSMRGLMQADGERYDILVTPGLGTRGKPDLKNLDIPHIQEHMDGSAVFEFSIIQVPRAFKEFFKLFDTDIDRYDACILHQANLFMLKHIGKKLRLPADKMPITLDRYGNTSSASIPLTICDYKENGGIEGVRNLICSGFGIGLSWGVIDFEVDMANVLPVLETDAYFEGAF